MPSRIWSQEYFIGAQESSDLRAVTIMISHYSLLWVIGLLLRKSLFIFFMDCLFYRWKRLKCLLVLKHELFKFRKKLFFAFRYPFLNYFFDITWLLCLRERSPFISNNSIYLSWFISNTQSLCDRLLQGHCNILSWLRVPRSIEFLSFELVVFLNHIVFQAGWGETMSDADQVIST